MIGARFPAFLLFAEEIPIYPPFEISFAWFIGPKRAFPKNTQIRIATRANGSRGSLNAFARFQGDYDYGSRYR